MITVCEEVFLLMLDYDTGRPSTRLPDRRLHSGLGGALLMDLALADRIDTDIDGLFVVDATRLGEPVLDRALARIHSDGTYQPIEYWVGVFADDYQAVRSMVVDRLAARKIVTRGRDGMLLVMGTRRCCDKNGQPLRDVRQRLAGELLSDEVPDPRDIMIVSLAEACALWPSLLDESAHARLAPKIAQIAKMDLIGQAVTLAIRRRQEAGPQPARRRRTHPPVAGQAAAEA